MASEFVYRSISKICCAELSADPLFKAADTQYTVNIRNGGIPEYIMNHEVLVDRICVDRAVKAAHI